MSRTKRYLGRKAFERLPGPMLDLLGPAVLAAVDQAVEHRWDRAIEAASAARGDTAEARVRSVIKRFRRELATVGAATGAVAATPGIGTGAAASALVADVGWLALRVTDLIMTIGAAHGLTDATLEERRAWVLALLAFGDSAAEEFAGIVQAIDIEIRPSEDRLRSGLGLVAGLAGSDALTVETLRRANANLAGRVVTRYGSRRGAVALGKLLPFGLGAAWGGATTWTLIRMVGASAARFFASFGDPTLSIAGPAGRGLPTGS